MKDIRRIDLTVPTGWNQCSTEQLEQITQNLLYLQATQDRYHPYDPLKFKARCFFSLAGIEVVDAMEGNTYLCRFVGDKKAEPFPMADWQLMSFINDNLQWLDDFNQLQIFPYDTYGRWPHRLDGPQPLLDGYTWQRYRQTQDYLQLYVMLTNELDQTTPGPSRSASPLGSSKNSGGEIEDARVHFLMAVFDAQKPYRCLRRMPDYQFQLILIWWQSQMAWCQQKFKRCFKKSDSGSGALPIELYTRSTATLQKYLSLSEEQIDCQPALVILQHLEDMSREAEEMERIRRHSKH